AGYHLLFYGYGRWQSLDVVALGLLHPAKKLTGISRETLHIAALTLGIEGVEGKRRLTRTADASYGDELVAWYLD
ncbi:MAG: hypothetical protein J6P01_01560, partial [Prevotella sp.]|nr:hypothetical protein [Prevotella sp.]